jgi:membrane fusion protein (multidrug efflux system)
MRNLFCAAFITILILNSCEEKKPQGPGQSTGPARNGPLLVEGLIASPVSISQSVEVTGTILPFESTEIRPEISGRMIFLNIREGANAAKGELLAKLFDADLQAQLKKLKVQLQIAEKTEERQRELLKINGISQQDYDLSLLSVKNLNADIDLIKVNISRTEIRAPYSGRLGLKRISPGAYVTPANILATISQVNQLRLEFSIPEKYSSEIFTGMEIRFTVEGSPGVYAASIAARESSVEETTRNLVLHANVKNGDRYLVPGSFAKVRITLGKNDDALMIPSQSIIPVARGKQVVVYKGGEVIFRNIVTGIRDSARVQVLDGISEGDTIITTGLMFLRPDSKVKITKFQ